MDPIRYITLHRDKAEQDEVLTLSQEENQVFAVREEGGLTVLPHQSFGSTVVQRTHPVNCFNQVVVGRSMLRIIRCSLLPADSTVYSMALIAFFFFLFFFLLN